MKYSDNLKRSYRDIAKSLNIGVSAISDYLARTSAAEIGWTLPEGLSEQELYDRLFLPVSDKTQQRPLPDWEYTHCELRKKGVTLQLLWREYRDVYPQG